MFSSVVRVYYSLSIQTEYLNKKLQNWNQNSRNNPPRKLKVGRGQFDADVNAMV